MKSHQINMLAAAAMIGGQQAAISVLEGLNDDVLGAADVGGSLSLPRPRDAKDKEITEAWGFVWPDGAVYDRNMSRGQELCVEVKVPAEWSVVATDHRLYKDLLDPKGQVRASLMIHYQDHDSWLSIVPKYRSGAWRANYTAMTSRCGR